MEDRPAETCITQNDLAKPIPYNNADIENESINGSNDFLGDSAGKLRTYVHRRNKRLSTVLNIIVLGSIITAAGVAIGHMWGVRDDCSAHSTQSVNKILSNLYKLQEENAYLRNKLKELTTPSHVHMKLPPKHMLRCKKVFEEPLNNKNVERLTKCIEHDNFKSDKLFESHLVEPAFEKEYLNDIDKLKNVYKQNRSWLDEEVARRLKDEEISMRRLKDKLHKPDKTIKLNKTIKNDIHDSQIIGSVQDKKVTVTSHLHETTQPTLEEKEKKISYADSLKLEVEDAPKSAQKREISNVQSPFEHGRRKRVKRGDDTIRTEMSESDGELKKDDRYVGNKHKLDRKKHDRQKTNKKQKRRNKYEQWEMKGGYMKDFDEFSLASSHEERPLPRNPNTNPDKNFRSQNYESVNYMDQFSETDENVKSIGTETMQFNPKKGKKDKDNSRRKGDIDWFEKRAMIRSEARRNLERELFGQSSPNTAAWYFRRMKKREQCRVKADNSTHKKIPKRDMNFKTKH